MHPNTPISKSQALTIASRFIASKLLDEPWYRQTKECVKAIVLYGSTAKGLNRTDSDIDLLFFMPLKMEKQYTVSEYLYKYDAQEINIVIRSIERLRDIARTQEDSFQKEIFSESAIIESADDEVENLLVKIAETQ